MLTAVAVMNKIATALELPYRPAVFDPVHQAWFETSDIIGGVKRIIAERDEAQRQLADHAD